MKPKAMSILDDVPETSRNEIVMMPTGNIKPYPNNPRHNDDAVEKVANSIKEFGFRSPIIVDKDMVVIAGHTRLKASKVLGLKEVPVMIAGDLSDEQARAYRLADNKTAELAYWDEGLLDTELSEIMDLDMSNYGFEESVDMEGFGEDFILPDGEKTGDVRIAFIMTEAQSEIVYHALDCVEGSMSEDSVNKNGWKIAEVCKQWLEQKM